jgi:arylsulfatase A-like enzyme
LGVGLEPRDKSRAVALKKALPMNHPSFPIIVRLWALFALPGVPLHALEKKPNVLFIAVDDLNHWVGHLGRNVQTKTPNIDRLASMGVAFTHAYCAAPVCNPSRAALMSGLRPGATGVYGNGNDWRKVIAPELTLTTAFRKAGYEVRGAGKIYHEAYNRDSEWDEYFRPKGGEPQPAQPSQAAGGIRPFGPVDAPDEDTPDYKIASYGVDELAKKHDKPFFLAVGLHKPHMPWNVPKKYYDLFPLESTELPPFKEDDLNDIPPEGLRMSGPKAHDAIVRADLWKRSIQGYLAATAFCDVQIGRLLEALEKSAYKDNTIVCFWGDHGWNLGEKHHWRKFALWEETTRAPFIWVAPGVTKPGGRCERTVDFMSIFPTLCDLCGMETPTHVQGTSIRALLTDPQAAWEHPAITTYGRNNHAVRTSQWRYIHYAQGGEELYDESKDPYEWTNVAGKTEFAPIKEQLAKFLPTENKPAVAGRAVEDE